MFQAAEFTLLLLQCSKSDVIHSKSFSFRLFNPDVTPNSTLLTRHLNSKTIIQLIPSPCNLNMVDQDKGPMLLALWWAEAGVATVVVGLRFYTRHVMRAIVIEDWLMLIALVSPFKQRFSYARRKRQQEDQIPRPSRPSYKK